MSCVTLLHLGTFEIGSLNRFLRIPLLLLFLSISREADLVLADCHGGIGHGQGHGVPVGSVAGPHQTVNGPVQDVHAWSRGGVGTNTLNVIGQISKNDVILPQTSRTVSLLSVFVFDSAFRTCFVYMSAFV